MLCSCVVCICLSSPSKPPKLYRGTEVSDSQSLCLTKQVAFLTLLMWQVAWNVILFTFMLHTSCVVFLMPSWLYKPILSSEITRSSCKHLISQQEVKFNAVRNKAHTHTSHHSDPTSINKVILELLENVSPGFPCTVCPILLFGSASLKMALWLSLFQTTTAYICSSKDVITIFPPILTVTGIKAFICRSYPHQPHTK